MADISDYILWRADIPFTISPFNEIDALILCQILYIDFDGIISDDFKSGITLKEAARKYALRHMNDKTKDFGVFINPRSADLLEAAGNSLRFGGIELKGFINDIDIKKEKQFAAFTASVSPRIHCIVYRGTDDTLVGWKEDFNMAVYDPVPSQQAALDYLEKAQNVCRGKLYTAGHSKGGNLALYAPAFCTKKLFKRIETIFCFDGPGFNSDTCKRGDTGRVFAKAACFVPQSSVVGILLHHSDNCTVIQSSEANGVSQHDAFSWQLHGKDFAILPERSDESVFTENTVSDWLKQVSKEARAEFINSLFDAASSGGALTLTELKTRWLQTSAAALKKLHNTDSDTRERIFTIFKLFLKAVRSNLPVFGNA
ncbi:Mbeg1-like protein [Treponema sp. HNW]|uniref:Mbeg1-like protein n=1 Tax=Treponema sp. HNW TaxID=3116654 RepID=UPI003D110354